MSAVVGMNGAEELRSLLDSVRTRFSSTQLREKQEEGGGASISLRSEEKITSCPILRVLTRASRW